MGPAEPQPETPRRSGASEYLLLEQARGEISRWVRSDFQDENRSSDLFLGIVLSLLGDFER